MADTSGAPYKIVKRGTKYAVVNNMNITKAVFEDEEKARKYQAALYVNVPGASKRAAKVKWSGKQQRQAAAEPITMSDGKYPIATQKDAKDAWDLRAHSTTHSEAAVVAHIRRACQKLGLKFPGAAQDREKAMATGLHLTIAQLRELGREYNVEERKKAAKEGAAQPDGSFPIYNQRDLDHGAELLHDAHDPASARVHMVKRAKKLGLRLPYSWPEGRDQAHTEHMKRAREAHQIDRARQGAGDEVPFRPAAREAAARRQSFAAGSAYRPHGFVYPTGLPNCLTCSQAASASVHINPMTPAQMQATSLRGGIEVAASLGGDKRSHPKLQRAHPYSARNVGNVKCQACGEQMSAQLHKPGMPVGVGIDYLVGSNDGPPGGGLSSSALGGMVRAAQTKTTDDKLVRRDAGTGAGPEEGYGEMVLVRHAFRALPGQNSVGADYKMCALCGFAQDDEVHNYKESDEAGGGDTEKNLVRVKVLANPTGFGTRGSSVADRGPTAGSQRAFVAESNGKVVLAAPANVVADPDQLPRELALAWQRAAMANGHFLWLSGRFVEADQPNRNKAMWSTKDLELGEPTVAHGPLNWLHEERHIIGSIADAKLIHVDRESAALGVGNHIAAAAVVWPWLWPNEARMIEAASEEGRLWYSMECVSRQVSCVNCKHEMTYRDYMTKANDRCGHMRMGEVRRFAEPSFLGGAVILPPVRPGWAHANVSVMRQAASEVERQAAAFAGMEADEAELLAARIITSTWTENS